MKTSTVISLATDLVKRAIKDEKDFKGYIDLSNTAEVIFHITHGTQFLLSLSVSAEPGMFTTNRLLVSTSAAYMQHLRTRALAKALNMMADVEEQLLATVAFVEEEV